MWSNGWGRLACHLGRHCYNNNMNTWICWAFGEINAIFYYAYFIVQYEGASTIKWTTPYPCLVLTESDLILCPNFKLFWRKIHRHFKYILLIYKAKQFMMTKESQEKSTYFRGWCKWCACRWCWANGCLNFV